MADGFGFVFGQDHGGDFEEPGAEGFGVTMPAVDEDRLSIFDRDDHGNGDIGAFGFVPVDFDGLVIHALELREGAHLNGPFGGFDEFLGLGEVVMLAGVYELFAEARLPVDLT